jgi:predicted MPP superfamily phosphohydrolase
VGLAVGYAFGIEPRWLAVRVVRLVPEPSLRIVHITDLHYAGDRAYLERVVSRVNATSPDLVCFTGDLVEVPEFLDEALALLSEVRRPMFGVRGNHDAFAPEADGKVKACFRATGGRWLLDEEVTALAGRLRVFGSTGRTRAIAGLPQGATCSLLLVHDPGVVRHLQGLRFDLILAGHTHGGQVRLPGRGALLDLPVVGAHDRGLFQTPVGPLHVNPGLGTFFLPVRFGCRPEIAVIEL